MIESLSGLREQSLSTRRASYDFDAEDPRALKHLSIEQQKKRAKELLKQWRAGQSAALDRGNKHLFATSMSTVDKLKLSDAQHVIAREHQFINWSAFKAHIEHATIESQVIKKGNPIALDADMRTLHIRCGSDIQHTLSVAGFCGDFMSFPDPYIQGPVPQTESLQDFIKIRADFIKEAYNVPNALKGMTEDYDDLANAKSYERVMLWFEHDSYDQLILARLLDFFRDKKYRPQQMQFICVTHVPGVKIFNGVGQLPPEALRVLWKQFNYVEEKHYQLGHKVWQAVTAPIPERLVRLTEQGTQDIPTMSGALIRHLQELPSEHNGLNLTEQLTLQILKDKGDINAARLFGWYTNHYEPLTFLGDTGYWLVLNQLANAQYPAITIDRKGESPKDWHVTMTEIGSDLLADSSDWISMNGIDRWLGGTYLNAESSNVWRYNSHAGIVIKDG